MNSNKQFYTPKDLIQMGLGSQGTVYELFNAKGFPSFKVGSALRIAIKDFDRWIEKQKL